MDSHGLLNVLLLFESHKTYMYFSKQQTNTDTVPLHIDGLHFLYALLVSGNGTVRIMDV